MSTGIVFTDGPQKVDDGAVTTNVTLTLQSPMQPGEAGGILDAVDLYEATLNLLAHIVFIAFGSFGCPCIKNPESMMPVAQYRVLISLFLQNVFA